MNESLINQKVLIIDPSFFTFQYDLHLYNGLKSLNYDVILVGSHKKAKNYCNKFEYVGLFYKFSDCIKNDKIRVFIKWIEHFFNMVYLLYFARNYSIIHFQWCSIPIVDRYFIKFLKIRKKVIFTSHDVIPFNGNPSSFLQTLGWSNLLKEFHYIIVHTKKTKSQIIKLYNINEKFIKVIPHGILLSSKEQTKLSAKFNLLVSSSKKKFLVFGAIKPYKGIDILIKSISLINNKFLKNCVFIISGKDYFNHAESLKELSIKLNVSQYIFWDIRYVPDEELPMILEFADIYLFPYKEISTSGVLMTVLPYVKPIIASKIGIFEELLTDKIDSLLYENNDDEAEANLANKIETLLSNPSYIPHFKNNISTLIINELSWENIARKTFELYES
ncbi:glycosyltransferase [Fluviispira multicolorata]|uniref:Glycosyltransferase n=1 Tax=Fluviispira multicolorata TaxID=2654512 RepID=A0A833JD94_9BACT|nr:glycosyltransferase [Fluviispira multicolorata]KAB8030662.1 glycosyltransferase [Fluviispira multicolorata]